MAVAGFSEILKEQRGMMAQAATSLGESIGEGLFDSTGGAMGFQSQGTKIKGIQQEMLQSIQGGDNEMDALKKAIFNLTSIGATEEAKQAQEQFTLLDVAGERASKQQERTTDADEFLTTESRLRQRLAFETEKERTRIEEAEAASKITKPPTTAARKHEMEITAGALLEASGLGATTTKEEKNRAQEILSAAGLASTDKFKTLAAGVSSIQAQERGAVIASEKQAIITKQKDLEASYKPVITGLAQGSSLAGDAFNKLGEPKGFSDKEVKGLRDKIGAVIDVMDNALSTQRTGITPAAASSFYTTALEFPGVYEPGSAIPLIGDDGSFDETLYRKVLDKAFARKGTVVDNTELLDYAKTGLLIPGVTKIKDKNGKVGIVTAEVVALILSQVQ